MTVRKTQMTGIDYQGLREYSDLMKRLGFKHKHVSVGGYWTPEEVRQGKADNPLTFGKDFAMVPRLAQTSSDPPVRGSR